MQLQQAEQAVDICTPVRSLGGDSVMFDSLNLLRGACEVGEGLFFCKA